MLRLLRTSFSRISPKIDYTKNYYKILKIPEDADQSQIRIHYYKLATRYHPDSQTANSEKYQNVLEAFKVLSDLEYKQKYDTKKTVRESTTIEQQKPLNTTTIITDQLKSLSPASASEWEVKLTVKQGSIEHQFFFNESQLQKKSTDRTELDQAAINMITNLKTNTDLYNDYVKSKGSATTIKQLLEIAALIVSIILTKRK